MEPELDEKAGVTELQVRMDCNGCVQRIKRVLHGIDGVQNIYVDLACQKLTVVGTADPEKIVKAIKKTRKNATISTHKEPGSEQPQPPDEQPPSGDPAPASDAAAEAPSPPDPPKDDTAPPQDGANPEPEAKPSPEGKEEERIHMVHHSPYYDHYVPMEQWNHHRSHPQRQDEILHEHVADGHSRDTQYQCYAAAVGYDGDGNYNHSRRDGSQLANLFSDENPNACRIV